MLGHPRAQFYMGIQHVTYQAKAADYFQLSANQGDPLGHAGIAFITARKQEHIKAALEKGLKELADVEENVFAQLFLGFFLKGKTW